MTFLPVLVTWIQLLCYAYSLGFLALRLPGFLVVTHDRPYRHDVITRKGRPLFGAAITAIAVTLALQFLNARSPAESRTLIAGGASAAALLVLSPFLSDRDRPAVSLSMLAAGVFLGLTLHPPLLDGMTRESLVYLLSDRVHLIAGALWGGGAFALVLFVLPSLLKQGNLVAAAETSRSYMRISGHAALLLAVSGVLLLRHEWGSLRPLWKTASGLVAFSKMLVFYFLVLLWAFNRFISVPVLRHLSGTRVEGPGVPGRIIELVLSRLQYRIAGPAIVIFIRLMLVEALLLAVLFFSSAVLNAKSAPAAGSPAPGAERKEAPQRMHQIHLPGGGHHEHRFRSSVLV